jgi:hypothetical protein
MAWRKKVDHLVVWLTRWWITLSYRLLNSGYSGRGHGALRSVRGSLTQYLLHPDCLLTRTARVYSSEGLDPVVRPALHASLYHCLKDGFSQVMGHQCSEITSYDSWYSTMFGSSCSLRVLHYPVPIRSAEHQFHRRTLLALGATKLKKRQAAGRAHYPR